MNAFRVGKRSMWLSSLSLLAIALASLLIFAIVESAIFW